MLISEECLYGSVFLKEMCQMWRICSFCLLLLFLASRTLLRHTIDAQYIFCDWLNERMNEWWILSEREIIYNLFIFSIYRSSISFVKNDLAKLLTNNWLATVLWKSEHREFWAKKI